MKMILAALTMLVPGLVNACERCATMGGAMMRRGGCATRQDYHLPLFFSAGLAALGYWILHHSSKDSGYVRRAGQVVGWVLVVGGLGGFLCGAARHGRKMVGAMNQCSTKGEGMSGAMQMPAGHPPIDGMSVPAEAPAAKKKGK